MDTKIRGLLVLGIAIMMAGILGVYSFSGYFGKISSVVVILLGLMLVVKSIEKKEGKKI